MKIVVITYKSKEAIERLELVPHEFGDVYIGTNIVTPWDVNMIDKGIRFESTKFSIEVKDGHFFDKSITIGVVKDDGTMNWIQREVDVPQCFGIAVIRDGDKEWVMEALDDYFVDDSPFSDQDWNVDVITFNEVV